MLTALSRHPYALKTTEEAVKAFKKYGAIGIFLLMSLGKTVIGTTLYSEVKPREDMPHGLMIPGIALKEQWTQFFEKNCPSLLDEVKMHTYQELSRKMWPELRKVRFTLLGFDECLPYDSHIALADGTSEMIGRIVEEKLNVKVLHACPLAPIL